MAGFYEGSSSAPAILLSSTSIKSIKQNIKHSRCITLASLSKPESLKILKILYPPVCTLLSLTSLKVALKVAIKVTVKVAVQVAIKVAVKVAVKVVEKSSSPTCRKSSIKKHTKSRSKSCSKSRIKSHIKRSN